MGIAKSIEAYSIYENYNSDTEKFIKDLSDKLNADFIINVFDKEYKYIGKENTHTNFDKQNKYRLTITFNEYKIGEQTKELPTYEISLPIKYIYEDSIELTFYPNHSLHITFLTFEHLWSSFIDTLKFISHYSDRDQDIKNYHILRNEYINILCRIDINQIFITTHAYYKIESVTDIESFHRLTSEKIIEVATEEDNLSIFNFQAILAANDITQLDKNFLDKSDLEILLIDNLKNI